MTSSYSPLSRPHNASTRGACYWLLKPTQRPCRSSLCQQAHQFLVPQLLTSLVKETLCHGGQNVMNMANFPLPTLVCSLPQALPAHIEQWQFPLDPGSPAVCLEKTVTLWSRMDLLGIDSLKVLTCEQTMQRLAFGCIAKLWAQNFLFKTLSLILIKFHPEILQVFCDASPKLSRL